MNLGNSSWYSYRPRSYSKLVMDSRDESYAVVRIDFNLCGSSRCNVSSSQGCGVPALICIITDLGVHLHLRLEFQNDSTGGYVSPTSDLSDSMYAVSYELISTCVIRHVSCPKRRYVSCGIYLTIKYLGATFKAYYSIRSFITTAYYSWDDLSDNVELPPKFESVSPQDGNVQIQVFVVSSSFGYEH